MTRAICLLPLLAACGEEPSPRERCYDKGGAWGVSGSHVQYRQQKIGKSFMMVPYEVTDYACFKKGERLE